MKNSVIAIELDAADPVLLETWMEQGYLPNLNRLRQSGAYGRLENVQCGISETRWTTLLTGCLPEKTSYWGPLSFKEGTYDFEVGDPYRFQDYPPFYALGDDYRVAVFDIPQTVLSDRVNGIQVLGWGAHAAYTGKQSSPKPLFQEISQTYGNHPTFPNSNVDNWWTPDAIAKLQRGLKTGIARRTAICCDLLKQERWNLFFTAFNETHPSGHHFWQLSQTDHPLYPHATAQSSAGDLLLEIYQATDRAIGEILAAAPEDATMLIFSTHGMGHNSTILTSTVFLPEFLYRYSFPGKTALAPGDANQPPPPILNHPKRKTWMGELWQLRHEPNLLKRLCKSWLPTKYQDRLDRWFPNQHYPTLISPYRIYQQSGKYAWQPTTWYQPLWPRMKAFVLPTFGNGEGLIRINLQGREPDGIVPATEFETVCEDLTQQLCQLTDARTGKPIVERVIRTNQQPLDPNLGLPAGDFEADLVVIWADLPTDVVDSPQVGRIGPIPYLRTGGHKPRGFCFAKGQGFSPGSTIPTRRAVDMTPTILQAMGAPIPDYVDGSPIEQARLVG